MNSSTPTAGRTGRIVTVEDHRRWQTTGRPPHEDDADLENPDIDSLLAEIRQAEPSTDGIKPSRIAK
jgi:hypothetical protein